MVNRCPIDLKFDMEPPEQYIRLTMDFVLSFEAFSGPANARLDLAMKKRPSFETRLNDVRLT